MQPDNHQHVLASEPNQGDIEEDLEPKNEQVIHTQTNHMDATRKVLAGWFVALLAATIAAGAVGWFMGKDLTDWVSFTTPLFTLTGVVITFYFTHQNN